MLEFTADFSGSENIYMDGDINERLTSFTVINPFEKTEVAKLIMKKDWRLKTKFKFTMRPVIKELQVLLKIN